jgi:hypothetical protein
VIAARGVTKAFGRRPVLRDVELELAAPRLVRVEGAKRGGQEHASALTWLAATALKRIP